MAHRTVEIRVVSRQNSDGKRTQISVTLPDGDTRTFGSLEEMPDDLRALAQPLFSPTVARRSRRTGLLKRSQTGLPESDGPGEASRMDAFRTAETSNREKRPPRRRKYEIIHWWFDPLAAGGGLALTVFPLMLIGSVLSGKDSWTFWSWCALLLSAGGLYLMLAFLVNRTRLTGDENGLTVHHGPLPWSGNQHIPREDLHQLFVQVRNSSRANDYSLCAHTSSGICRLVGSGDDPNALRQYEEELENYFGIEDRAVRGNQYR
ncbi:MAG: hypothetical protein ACK526_04720 [Planctomyces sp.]|jgi:hypothetical protein